MMLPQSQYVIGLYRDVNPTKNWCRPNVGCPMGKSITSKTYQKDKFVSKILTSHLVSTLLYLPINKPIYEYDIRNTSDFAAHRIKKVRCGSKSLSYLGPRSWNILPDEDKKIQSVQG